METFLLNDLNPMEEMKLAQDIISKQEDFTFKVFSWAIGMITALTLGFYHTSIRINEWVYMLSGFVIIIVFFLVAKKHWATFYNAIKRSEKIETEMKNDNYAGVKLNEELKTGDAFSITKHPRFYLPYVALILLVLISGAGKIMS